jgi:hypothetical protein
MIVRERQLSHVGPLVGRHGRQFFAIKGRALPLECRPCTVPPCPNAYDCHDPEMYAKDLVISKVEVEVDMAYLQTSGLRA